MGTWPRRILLCALVFGVLVRVYPQHRPEPNPELQEHFPRLGVISVATDAWKREHISHGVLLLDVLEVVYEAWFRIGRVTGRYADRVDVLVDYLNDSRPFVVAAKAVVAGCSLATLLAVWRVTALLFGAFAGAIAMLFLAVSFVHVRETHHVWLDVVGGLGAMLVLLTSLSAMHRRTNGAVMAAGFVTGLAVAANHRDLVVTAVPMLAILLGSGVSWRTRVGRMFLTGLCAVAAFALVSPLVFLDFEGTRRQLTLERAVWAASEGQLGLPLPTLIYYGLGVGTPALAVVGLLAGFRERPRATAVALVFPVLSGVVLIGAPYVFVRYLASVAPFVALFAGSGAIVVGRRLGDTRGVAAAIVAVVVAIPPAIQSAGYARLRGRTDTRILAGRWIEENVPRDVPLTVPNMVRYPNPQLPAGAARIRREYRALADELIRRGAGASATGREVRYLKFLQARNTRWTPVPGEWVVTAAHPHVTANLVTDDETMGAIRRAGGDVVATFSGFDGELPARTVFEPRDAEYLPLAGFTALRRPGPTLTIWRIPGTAYPQIR